MKDNLKVIGIVIVFIMGVFLLITVPIWLTGKWWMGVITYVSVLIGLNIWRHYSDTRQRCPQCGYSFLRYLTYPSEYMMEHEEWNCPVCSYKKIECAGCNTGVEHWIS